MANRKCFHGFMRRLFLLEIYPVINRLGFMRRLILLETYPVINRLGFIRRLFLLETYPLINRLGFIQVTTHYDLGRLLFNA